MHCGLGAVRWHETEISTRHTSTSLVLLNSLQARRCGHDLTHAPNVYERCVDGYNELTSNIASASARSKLMATICGAMHGKTCLYSPVACTDLLSLWGKPSAPGNL